MPNDIFFIMGPTASGKSTMASEKADAMGGEIINADSRQLYGDLKILAANPSAVDMEKIPHHLYEILTPYDTMNVAAWCRVATEKIHEVWGRGKVPFVVGGTGFYFKALTEGLHDIPEISEEIKKVAQERLVQEGVQEIHAWLGEKHPAHPLACNPSDTSRVLRALEVYLETGGSLGSFQIASKKPFLECTPEIILMDPPRDELRRRIAQRQHMMFEEGAISEVSEVLKKQKGSWAPGFQGTIGFQEITAFLKGGISEAKAQELMLHRTRQYAKRQQTWFRHQKLEGFYSVCWPNKT